jgi:transposase-like protein
MENKRKRYGADFKFKVALEAVKERQTMSELTAKYGVHSTQIGQWKKQLLDEGLEVFKESTKGKKDNHQELVGRLYQQIGQLQVELDWLKKKQGMG